MSGDDLRSQTATTLRHYEEQAESYRDGTRDHDVTQNLSALYRAIEAGAVEAGAVEAGAPDIGGAQTGPDARPSTGAHDACSGPGAADAPAGRPPWTILDFGCGPGRDLATIAGAGHVAVGLDGSLAFVRMARAATGCEVLHQNFVDLHLSAGRFDGVFANASLQHVPRVVLPAVLGRLHAALKPRGALVASIPRGDDDEGWHGLRYSVFHAPQTWDRFVADAGFDAVERYFRPTGAPPAEQRWYVSVWRRR